MAAETACPKPAALPGQTVARDVRRKCTSDALNFREDRLIELDVAKADCHSEPIDVEQVDEVAAAAL
eukprot:6146662-Pleurochrysis_carterae.AAC.1